MIATTMLYLAAVSLAGTAAALAAGTGLQRLEIPARWAWLGAMLLGPVLLVGAQLADLIPGFLRVARPEAFALPIALPALIADGSGGATPWLAGADTVLGIAWAAGCAALGFVLLRGQFVLFREKRGSRVLTIHGQTVNVTARRGPAVAGLIRPWIIVPEWVLDLPDDQLRMVVAHESEHVRAGDSRVIAAGLGLAALTFWNPLSWWQLNRLRTALELDCDRRVLARDGDLRAYGSALLAVAAGVVPERSLALAAFSENAHSLRTRILAMTTRRSRWAKPVGTVLVLLAIVIGIQACGLESPVTPLGQNRASQPSAVAASGPYFTPFTKSPRLTNRDEVARALESEYPALLRNAGVEGRAEVWIRVSAQGQVEDVQINRTSGHQALDLAAIRVARQIEFTPAQNDGENVMVWVSIPITFEGNMPAQK